jgi:flagellar M-ring protein FliF
MDQLRKLFSGLSLLQRISILAVAALVVAGLVAFSTSGTKAISIPCIPGWRRKTPPRWCRSSRNRGWSIASRTTAARCWCLPPSWRNRAWRWPRRAFPRAGRIGFELFDKNNFGATEFVEHINYKRALEGELERSVMSLAEVEQARIHLTLPKESVFLDQQEPAKASVMVKLRAGAQISPQNVIAVTNLVASAVEGLAPEAVSLVDMDGNLLSKPRKTAAADGSEITAESLEVRQQLERALVTKISATLEPLLGANRFRAGASVDCDLTSGEQQEETLDPRNR